MISLSAEGHERLNSSCGQYGVRLLVLQHDRSGDEMSLWDSGTRSCCSEIV